jgi:hypothetical protein
MTPISWKTFVVGMYFFSFFFLTFTPFYFSLPYTFCVLSEIEITTERIKKILSSGANVVLTTKGIDDLCLKLFVEAGAMAVRRVKKEDMKRIAKAAGGIYEFFHLI